jgi:hypothetical protein
MHNTYSWGAAFACQALQSAAQQTSRSCDTDYRKKFKDTRIEDEDGWLSSAMLGRVVWQQFNDVSEMSAALIALIMETEPPRTSANSYQITITILCQTFDSCFHPGF